MRACKHQIAFFKFNCPFEFFIQRQGEAGRHVGGVPVNSRMVSVRQMDSPPRKINPDSPKEICVKLMLSWAGIWGESWHGQFNPLSALGLWEKRLWKAHLCRAQRWSSLHQAFSKGGGQGKGWGGVITQEGFPTWLHWICCWLFITPHTGSAFALEENCSWLGTDSVVHSPARTPTCHQMSNPVFRILWSLTRLASNANEHLSLLDFSILIHSPSEHFHLNGWPPLLILIEPLRASSRHTAVYEIDN